MSLLAKSDPERRRGSVNAISGVLEAYMQSDLLKKFEDEQSNIQYEDSKYNVTDLSHGTVKPKKDKYISDEANEYIRKLVAETMGPQGRSTGSGLTKPFVTAYSELNDLCTLYKPKKKKKMREEERVRLQTIADKIVKEYDQRNREIADGTRVNSKSPNTVQ